VEPKEATRPLRRAVREYLGFPLATLVAERGADPNQVIYVDAGDESLEFNIARVMMEAVFS
jgi:hypothetical protein